MTRLDLSSFKENWKGEAANIPVTGDEFSLNTCIKEIHNVYPMILFSTTSPVFIFNKWFTARPQYYSTANI